MNRNKYKLIPSKSIDKVLTGKYCPKCMSRLYPIDEDYMIKYGKCSYCVTYEQKPRGCSKNEPL